MTQIKMTSPNYVQGNPASGGITLFSVTPWTPIAGTTVTADSSSCVSANGVAGMVSTPNSRSVNVAWSASVNHGTTALYYGFADAPAATYAYHIYWYCNAGTATPYNHSTGLGNFAYSINDKFVITGDGTNWKFYQNGSLKATLAYSSVVTPVKVPYVYVNTVGTGFKQCEYRELTGSAIVPATTDISTSVNIKPSSIVAGGSPVVAPVSYSMTPWQSQSGFAFTTTPSSLVCTNYGSSANNVWAHVWSNTTPLQTNFRLAVQRHPVEWATVFGFFSGSIPNEFSISSINTKNSVLWYMDTGTSGHNSIVSSSANNTQSTGYTFTEAFTSQSVFEIQYNGTNYQFYINGVLKYTMVPMDNVNQQMIHPFFTTFRQVGPAGASSGFANISYGELTGSAATPSLPPTYITIR